MRDVPATIGTKAIEVDPREDGPVFQGISGEA